MSHPIAAPDITLRPPRSPRVRLGGFALLPRLLDKCRAALIGKNGEYNYACPLDQHFFRYTGIDPAALQAVVATGKGDGEVLEWIQIHAPIRNQPWKIAQWSEHHDRRGPDSDAETLAYFTGAVGKLTLTREDVRTWAELLDLDDHVTFGGRA